MPRPKNIVPTRALTIALPVPILSQIMLHLYSDLEERVPTGAYQRFFSERTQEFFSTQTRDFSSLAGLPPGTLQVRATPATLDALSRVLTKE